MGYLETFEELPHKILITRGEKQPKKKKERRNLIVEITDKFLIK